MDNNNQNEQMKKHERTKLALKVGGGALAAVGIIFLAIGLIDFFQSFGTTSMPTKFWCMFVGIPLAGVGLSLLVFGFKREIGRYVKNEAVPIINEAGREIAPAVADIAAAAREGLRGEAAGVRCACGQLNDQGSKYCKQCGKNLVRICPDCQTEVSADSAFCDKCGRKLL